MVLSILISDAMVLHLLLDCNNVFFIIKISGFPFGYVLSNTKEILLYIRTTSQLY